jgi:MFS family permease
MGKLTMLADLHMTEAAYGLGAGLFFLGYFAFEVPSNLILHKVGARRWIARIMITWGLVSMGMALVNGPRTFYGLRILLGVAEAGFFPGIVLYLTYWIPARYRARILAAFLTSTALSGAVGNPLAGQLMRLDGIGHLHGWQWLFLIEGIPAVLLGIAILVFPILPDRPAKARWLSEEEAHWLEGRLAADGRHPHVNHIVDLRAAARDPWLGLLSVVYFMLIMGLYGFIYWLPSIVKNVSMHASDARIGALSAIPCAVAALAMILIGAYVDRARQRQKYVAASAIIGAIGLAAVGATTSSHACLAALTVAAIGIFGSLGPFWAIPTRYLRGPAAAAGIAVINSVGALAGFVAPYAIGWAKTHRGSTTAGLLLVSFSLLAAAGLVLLIPSTVDAPHQD